MNRNVNSDRMPRRRENVGGKNALTRLNILKIFPLINSIYSLNTLGTNILELFLVLVALGLGKGLAPNMFGASAPTTNKKMLFVSSSAMHVTHLVSWAK